jgi:PQQ-dependent catabolism-associated CXXCW motif protein
LTRLRGAHLPSLSRKGRGGLALFLSIALASTLSCVLAGAARTEPAAVPEPSGYRLDDYRAPVPATLAGATAVGTAEAEALWREHRAVFVDVLPAPRRPEKLPPDALWKPLPRRDIPGSQWLPEVGRGALSPALETYFRENLERVTQGDKAAPLVFYCLADCWMSWNATKRALRWGYTGARWYEAGTDGWDVAGFPLAAAPPPADAP